MKVTVKLTKRFEERTCHIYEEIHEGIAMVLWEDDRVRLVFLDSKIQQISYRKDLVFAVIEEEE
jgi:hypothetical protein